ncbi:peptide ABC transporter substrate-binding protein [Halorubrum sp. HHNYT27]|uniref:peptide ABC transporter substrate-binding protein n=1 Tax=Halorubrum sp. HHNYT27 TaxID=3402275 RepID=UPI003EB843E8
MPETPAYHEHLLDASDVCNSCHRIIRVERIEPTREGLGREFESVYERRRETTEIGYGPARSVSEEKGVFCDRCGTESPYDRIWDDAEKDISYERFREIIQATIRTLEFKGVTISREDFAQHALQHRLDGNHVDDCLGAATEAAIVAAINRTDADQEGRREATV